MRRTPGTSVLALVCAAFLLTTAAPALAHEGQAAGDLELVVGWGFEPAFSGQQNFVELMVTDHHDGKPVTTPAKSLTATVMYGDQKLELPLETTYDPDTASGKPGQYAAWLIPTAPGDYTFKIAGAIGGQKIDQSFTSGPTTFSPVLDPATAQFPVKTPDLTQMAKRLQSEASRYATTTAVAQAQSAVSTARTFGIVGIVIGALGLAAGGFALARKRA
jgi:hypothetical protein